MDGRVRLTIEGTTAYLTLARPDKHNAMDIPLLKAVVRAQKELRKRRALRAVIVHGEGPSFCSGIDVKALSGRPLTSALLVARLWSPVRNIFQAWSMGFRELGVPVIAAIHGHCFGAGLQLALGADMRIARPDAQLSIMEAKWGLVPDMGGPTLLRELIPIDRAKELTMTGRVLTGEQAHALGLVTHVSADPLAQARELAREIEARSPDAVAAAKQLLQRAWDAREGGALAAERSYQRLVIGKKNQRIAVERNRQRPDAPYIERTVGR